MSKKQKVCNLDRAKQILGMIASFKSSAKGDADRAHFAPIVETSIRSGLMTKADSAKFGITPEMSSNALRGIPTGATNGARNIFLTEVRKRASALVPA